MNDVHNKPHPEDDRREIGLKLMADLYAAFGEGAAAMSAEAWSSSSSAGSAGSLSRRGYGIRRSWQSAPVDACTSSSSPRIDASMVWRTHRLGNVHVVPVGEVSRRLNQRAEQRRIGSLTSKASR